MYKSHTNYTAVAEEVVDVRGGDQSMESLEAVRGGDQSMESLEAVRGGDQSMESLEAGGLEVRPQKLYSLWLL